MKLFFLTFNIVLCVSGVDPALAAALPHVRVLGLVPPARRPADPHLHEDHHGQGRH